MPFEIFKQDKDEVIMLINYLIEKGESEEMNCSEIPNNLKSKNQRIRVNDKTATGGWF